MAFPSPLYVLTLCLVPWVAQANDPVITSVKASVVSDQGTRDFYVSVLHEDKGWDHYADRFEILSPDGKILATRILAHPHVNEQPFTREKYNVSIPIGLKAIDVRAHDKVHGYGPKVRIPVSADNHNIRFEAAN